MIKVSKAQSVAFIILCLTFILCVRLYADRGHDDSVCRAEDMLKFKSQRNDMSRMLNLRQQTIQLLECEKIKIIKSKSSNATSVSVDWCEETNIEKSGEQTTDGKLIPVLADFFRGMHVGSFGDGPAGFYQQKLLFTGKLKGYHAYDGSPFSEKMSDGRVHFLDFSIPHYGMPLYDWVMSLEFAEYIPQGEGYDSVFIDNVVRHAKYGVVISWAVPGAGNSHIMNRSPDYVRTLFEENGFGYDKRASQRLQDSASLPWLISNINVYRRIDTRMFDHL